MHPNVRRTLSFQSVWLSPSKGAILEESKFKTPKVWTIANKQQS
jgi:hypothetical protein